MFVQLVGGDPQSAGERCVGFAPSLGISSVEKRKFFPAVHPLDDLIRGDSGRDHFWCAVRSHSLTSLLNRTNLQGNDYAVDAGNATHKNGHRFTDSSGSSTQNQ